MSDVNRSQSGSVGGAILLIAGCCIGAGMLGLPVLSAMAGFKPSLMMFVLSWAFMTTTALLLLEVNLCFTDEVSIITMAERTLGVTGKIIGWSCFAFLFYTLGIAYVAGSGELISAVVGELLGIKLPHWVGSLAVCILFGAFVYLGTKTVDMFNRILMSGLVITYFLLVIVGAPHVNMEYFNHHDWSEAILVLPVMIISFGFHNLVPSLTTYLKGDAKRLRLAIICGSSIPLVIYLVWEWLILGLVPIHEKESFLQVVEKGQMATEVLKGVVKSLWVTEIAQYFAFFAIVTSFLGNSLSFVDFLADGLHIKKDSRGKLLLCFLVIAPSFILALIYPHIFLVALNYAGAFGAVILFGLLPALMVWSARYYKKLGNRPMVFGGKATLIAVILFTLWVMALQII